MGWREHVEWLDGIEEDSGDTNIYILTFNIEGVKQKDGELKYEQV